VSRAAQWWLLSDLHLGMSDEDPRRPGRALPEFLRREVLAASGRRVAVEEAPAAAGRFAHNVSGSGHTGILAARWPLASDAWVH
jgi:metallophosphoesterase superfamily enzyme